MDTTTTPAPVAPAKTPRRRTRGYSRDFPVKGDTGKRYLLDDIPAGLWTTARRQARRDGLSMRGLILKLLLDYTQRSITQG